jgi:hypothetical protein
MRHDPKLKTKEDEDEREGERGERESATKEGEVR